MSHLEGRPVSVEIAIVEGKEKLRSIMSATVENISEVKTGIETWSRDRSHMKEQVKQVKNADDTIKNDIMTTDDVKSEKSKKVNETIPKLNDDF